MPKDQVVLEFFVTCGQGLSSLVADELKDIGIKKPRTLLNGVAFFGTMEDAYRACLWLRTASRVLLVIARVKASDSQSLYESIKGITWEEHLLPSASFVVNAHGKNENLKNSQFIAVRVKDAIVDRFSDVLDRRPDVRRDRPDVVININLRNDRATVAIDLSGEPLHRRGYRQASRSVTASLRETLAAALVLCNGWTNEAGFAHQSFLIDPFCGSGTVAIEAALVLADRAPGLLRDYWGFTGWKQFDPAKWQYILDEADERAEKQNEALSLLTIKPILASDIDGEVLKVAEQSAKKAGVLQLIEFKQQDIMGFSVPRLYSKKQAHLATNPPYGQRMLTEAQLPALFSALAKIMSANQDKIIASVISSSDSVEAYLSPLFSDLSLKRLETMNGPLPATIFTWQAYKQNGLAVNKDNEDVVEQTIDETDKLEKKQRLAKVQVSAEAYRKRLQKVLQQKSKWAKQANVSCFRLYDSDLPDFNIAIDLYQGASKTADEGQQWLHIAEYRPPLHIDPQLADTRLVEAINIASEVVNVSPTNIFLKRRERAKGGLQYQQYASANNQSAIHLIEEGGLIFEVDFASHLDTGIFLDHRLTRELLREKAHQRDCLNLFSYTGSASVYMQDGNAKSVTSVDLSKTYLDWSKRNMMHNNYMEKNPRKGNPGKHRLFFEEADVLAWTSAKRKERPLGDSQKRGGTPKPANRLEQNPQAETVMPNRYGLIFVDVPTFSNSSKMKGRSWDVQRDHVELLIDVSRLLVRNGEAVFSTNLRSFKPDTEALAKAKVQLEDISETTIPPDFSRNLKVHKCYLLRREA
ncbi:MAG: bifunctional 23S rRNA (guanine(2069)-N(7))-methyltransferase RlmK/23S rRNA (guanine(2445)-N(2))-methyltransferase RlmL [Coriobacteriia bacterium]|nr:bifunctional 23S rRNA (guanine(2069)-N(7))-methyltransferase RlmK/23S rRNA (guanine(2445)-N(2))-methyltransferase RlmL [Coriobacteriia bacterium]